MKIAEFLKLRKQSDYVKIAMVLFIAVMYFIISGIIGVIGYARFASREVNYILQPNTTSALSDAKIADLCKMDGAVAASLMRQYQIIVQSAVGETGITVTTLSPEFLSKCYGISISAESPTFFVNKTALESLSPNSEKSAISLPYSDESGILRKSNFVKCDALPDGKAMAVRLGLNAELNSRTANNVYIRFDGTDIYGTREETLSQKGYSVSNQAELVKTDCEKEIMLSKLQMNFVSALFSAIGAIIAKQAAVSDLFNKTRRLSV